MELKRISRMGVVSLNDKTQEDLLASKMKTTESLKAELVEAVGSLFKSLLRADYAYTSDALASIIMITYIMGRKLGVEPHTIDLLAKEKLQTAMFDSHEKDQWHEDMNHLLLYLGSRKR